METVPIWSVLVNYSVLGEDITYPLREPAGTLIYSITGKYYVKVDDARCREADGGEIANWSWLVTPWYHRPKASKLDASGENNLIDP